MLGPGRDRASRARLREPQALDMFLSKCHCRVEADDWEVARDVQNSLNDSFAYLCFQVIQLSGIIPRKRCTIIAMINITDIAAKMIAALKDDGSIGLIVVMIFEIDTHTNIIREIL